MKLKDTEKSLIIALIGIAVVVLSYMYIIKPNMEDINTIKAESQQLQARLTELQTKQADRDKYLAGIDEYQGKFDEVLASFPADLNQEVTIMFLKQIHDDNEFDIEGLELGAKELFYTLGLNGGDAALDVTGEASAAGTTEAGTTEATTTEATTATDTGLAEGQAPVDENAFTCYRAAFPISYSGSYKSLKDVIAYVNNYQNRMTIDSIDIAYEADEDIYTGELNLMCYSVESAERPESTLEINDVETGVDNIFTGGGAGTASSNDSSLNKYDSDEGASIENNYDFYAMLNPATSDVSAKVVGQNGSGKEATVVSNSDNSASTLSYDFYEKDGKNYCKYTLDGTSYEAEITSAEDVKLLIQSSAKKDDDDKVGVRITIRNTTSLPVYVKVAGDDSASPRVTIVSKTGSVKVY